MTSTTDDTHELESDDWQDRLIAAAATVTLGPVATTEPIQLERLPQWISLDGLVGDFIESERRFELARQGRAFLPALAAWKREVVETIGWAEEEGQRNDFGDDDSSRYYNFTGVNALGAVLREIGWVGGDNESVKPGKVDQATLDAYAAEETGA